jgi:hypothetical protein
MLKKNYEAIVLQVVDLANDVITDSADGVKDEAFLEGIGKADIFN